MSNNDIVKYRAEDSKTPPNPEDCNVFPSLFGSADEDCYIEQPMPQVQELIKQVLYEKISSVGSRVIMDALIATGNEALVNAILAKSLTPQQAELLKQVAINPDVATALAQVKGRLLEGVEASVANVQETVLPKVQDAAAQVAKGTADAVENVIADIPFVGDAMALVDAATTGIGALENAVDIKNKVNTAIAPVQAAMGQIGTLTDALNTAATSASDAVSDAVSGATNAVSGVPNAVSGVTGVTGVTGVPPPPTAKPDEQIGGSRTRRRIHKLSRRIERTLRRVQKKYGLQDKNSFLRRTLKRK